jgi:hypothetical protein
MSAKIISDLSEARHGYRNQKNSLESFGLIWRRRIFKPSLDADSRCRRAGEDANQGYAVSGASHALWTG